MIACSETGTADKLSTGYIALYLDIRPDGSQVWRPVVDDAQGVAEMSLTAAVRACIRSMDDRFQRLRLEIATAYAQAQSARSGDIIALDLLRSIAARAASLHIEVAHLLDQRRVESDSMACTVESARPVRVARSRKLSPASTRPAFI